MSSLMAKFSSNIGLPLKSPSELLAKYIEAPGEVESSLSYIWSFDLELSGHSI